MEMKEMKMKTVAFSLAMLSLWAWADEPKKEKVVLDRVILYDGVQTAMPAPWIRVETRGEYVYLTDAISCGQLKVQASHISNAYTLHDHGSYSCAYTIAGLDLEAKSLLVLVDLQKNVITARPAVIDTRGYLVAQPSVRDSYPVARYLAAMSGTATDFFEGVTSDKTKKVKSSLDSLADVMTHLSRTRENVGQSRYVDGKLVLKHKGPMKFDPHARGLKSPTKEREPDKIFSVSEKDFSIDLLGHAEDVNGHPKPTAVYEALTKTMELLWDGYEELESASDDDAKAYFKKLIAENAQTISSELQAAIKLMREKNYHPLELVHFVNHLGDLVASIDRILQSKEGTDPGFFETLNGKRNRRGK